MKAFTIYWTPDGWKEIGEGNFPKVTYGSGFVGKIKKGDRVFIINVKDGELRLVSAFTARTIGPADDNIYGGSERITVMPGTAVPIRPRRISRKLISELRFISADKTLGSVKLNGDGTVYGQAMRAVRQLTLESQILLENELGSGISDSWTEDELRAAVVAYFDIYQKVRSGQKLVKKDVYRDLAKMFGRSPSAFEFRMQNISHVLSLTGRDWVPGLPPAKHVGTNVVAQIERIIAEVEGKEFSSRAVDAQSLAGKRRSIASRPTGTKNPLVVTSTSSSFSRDLSVKAWVLKRSNGICEACGESAPFFYSFDLPFLEVHHVRHLADGGSDTTSNAVALCPNCHRRLHYSKDARQYREQLFSKVSELERE